MEDQLFCSSEISNWVNPDCKGKAGRAKERERERSCKQWPGPWFGEPALWTRRSRVQVWPVIKSASTSSNNTWVWLHHIEQCYIFIFRYFFLLSVLLKVLSSHLHNAWKCLLSTQMRRINFRGGGGICLFVYFYLYDGKDWCEHVRRIYRRINAVIAVPRSFAYPN